MTFRYASICQSAGLVPIVEPEVLCDGDHTLGNGLENNNSYKRFLTFLGFTNFKSNRFYTHVTPHNSVVYSVRYKNNLMHNSYKWELTLLKVHSMYMVYLCIAYLWFYRHM